MQFMENSSVWRYLVGGFDARYVRVQIRKSAALDTPHLVTR